MSKKKNKVSPIKSSHPKKTKLKKETIGKRDNKMAKFGFPLLLFILFILIYQYIFNSTLNTNGDNYAYINYASAILDGHGYAAPNTPQYKPTNWFPPGYSSMLAVLMSVFGKNVFILKLFNGFLFFGISILIYKIFSEITEKPTLPAVVGALILCNFGLLRLSTQIMSEVPFSFFSILAVYCTIKLRNTKEFLRSRYFYLMILSVAIAYYTRSVGIVLIASIFLYLMIQKKWKVAGGFIAGVGILYLPWIIRNSIHGIEGRYVGTIMTVNPWRPEAGKISSVGEFIDKMQVNLYDTVLSGFPQSIFSFSDFASMSTTSFYILGTIVLAVVLFGAWRLPKINVLISLYILGNIAIFLIWHGGNSIRYVHPLSPILIFCFYYGIVELIKIIFLSLKLKIPSWLPFCFLGVIFLHLPRLGDLNKKSKERLHPGMTNYFQLAKNFKTKNEDGAVVICRKPGMFHYYSNAFTYNYKYSLDDKEIIERFINQDVDYVVIDQLGYGSTSRYLVPAIQKNQELFKTVEQLENPDTYLLKFDIEAARKKFGL